MKTAIVFYSEHHGNTKKLIDAIAAENDVTIIDATKDENQDLADYDLIGFASGIYYGKFAGQVIKYAERNLNTIGKKVFFLYTYGSERKSYCMDIESLVKSKGSEVVGRYGCSGFDTFGPFKLVGGLCKGHPDSQEIQGAVDFFAELCGKL